MKKMIVVITTYKDQIERFMPAIGTEQEMAQHLADLMKSEYFCLTTNDWESACMIIKSQDIRRLSFREWKE